MNDKVCDCCGKAAVNSIQIMTGANVPLNKTRRNYLPSLTNRNAIDEGVSPGRLEELPLCASCMRTVEDNFRATILYLKSENERLNIQEAG